MKFQNFEEATLVARALETFHAARRNGFDRTTRMLTKGQPKGFPEADPSKLRDRLREYQRDMEGSEKLIVEVRREIVRLSESTTVRRMDGVAVQE